MPTNQIFDVKRIGKEAVNGENDKIKVVKWATLRNTLKAFGVYLITLICLDLIYAL